MEKKFYKIISVLILIMTVFCFKITFVSASSLPECDPEFYGSDIIVDMSNNVKGDSKTFVQKINGEIFVFVQLDVAYKNTVNDLTYTITELEKDKKTVHNVCSSTIKIERGSGNPATVQFHFKGNSKSGNSYKYGTVYTMHFKGTYKNDKGSIIKYDKIDTVKVNRNGKRYSTYIKEGNTTVAPTKKPTTAKSNGNYNGEDSGSSSDSSSDSSDLIQKYTTGESKKLVKDSKKIQCDGGSGTSLKDLIDRYWKIIAIFSPVILLLFTSLDFMKAILASDADQLKKSSSNALKRTLAFVILIMLPWALSLVLGWFGLQLCF